MTKSILINRANSFCMILVVAMHCVITTNCEGSDFFNTFIFRTVNRIAVPIFFLISGYLLFYNYSISKIKKRTRTILIPFLLWSIISLIIFFVFKNIPLTARFINTDLQLSASFIFTNIFIHPINGALWFLRDLYLLILLSPIIYHILNHKILKRVSIIICAIIWIIDLKYSFGVESSFYFLLGGYLSNRNFDINHSNRSKKYLILLYFIILFISIHIVLKHQYNPIILSKISIILGFIVLTYNYNLFLLATPFNRLLDSFKKYSFFCYASHLIIAQFVKKIIVLALAPTDIYILSIAYLLTVCITIIICCTIQKILTIISPNLINILTGGRS